MNNNIFKELNNEEWNLLFQEVRQRHAEQNEPVAVKNERGNGTDLLYIDGTRKDIYTVYPESKAKHEALKRKFNELYGE